MGLGDGNARFWQDGYREFPNLHGLSPVQVLARLPEQDERYTQGEAGLRAVWGGIKGHVQQGRKKRRES